MKLKKSILLFICNFLLRFSIYGIVLSITFVAVFGNARNIKQAFLSTNAYQKFVPSLINSTLKSNQSTGSLPLKDPAVQKIIENSFPAPDLQAHAETVIDSTYSWLNGKTAKPDFVVDFSSNINTFSNNLAAYAFAKLKAQPLCKSSPAVVDPFSAQCRPENFDYDFQQVALADDIRANNSLLPKAQFTVDDLAKNDQGKTLVQQYDYAPRIFQLAFYAPWVFGVMAVIGAVGITYLTSVRRKAIGLIGVSLAGSSLFIITSPLFFLYVLPHFFPGFNAQTSGTDTRSLLGNVVTKLSTDFNNQLILAGFSLVVIGVLLIAVERAMRPKSKYVHVREKAGFISSDKPHTNKGKLKTSLKDVPIQTSEGERQTSKYQKDKRYRKIPKKEL